MNTSVKTKNKFKRIGMYFIAAGVLNGCSSQPSILATVGNEIITCQEFQTELRPLDKASPNEASLQFKKMFLNSIIRRKVLVIAAKREGLDLSKIRSDAPLDLSIPALYIKTLESHLQPSEEDMTAFYENHRDHFDKPLEHGEAIFVPTMEDAKKAQSFLAKGLSFEDVARDVMPIINGKVVRNISAISPFRRGERSPEFEKVFFSLKPGQTSGIVQILPTGYSILKRENPEYPVPYSEIHDEIRNLLVKIAVEKKIEAMILAAPVKINEKKLAELQL